MVILLAPFAPHIAEELWEVLGRETSVFEGLWPISPDGEWEYLLVQTHAVVFKPEPPQTLEHDPRVIRDQHIADPALPLP